MDEAAKLAKVSEPFVVQHTRNGDRDFLDLICYSYEYKLTFSVPTTSCFPLKTRTLADEARFEVSRSRWLGIGGRLAVGRKLIARLRCSRVATRGVAPYCRFRL